MEFAHVSETWKVEIDHFENIKNIPLPNKDRIKKEKQIIDYLEYNFMMNKY